MALLYSQIELACKNATSATIDTTYSVVAHGLLLTTILVWVEGKIALPAAWAIHEAKDKESYFRVLSLFIEHTGNAFRECTFVRDYDAAIKDAIKRVSQTHIHIRQRGDIWHLLHNNVKHLNQSGLSDLKTDVLDSIRLLAYIRGTYFSYTSVTCEHLHMHKCCMCMLVHECTCIACM